VRYARAFWPTFAERRAKLKIRVGRSLLTGPEALVGKWDLDKPTPFERHRIYSPTPDAKVPGPALAALKQAYPALSGVGVGSLWAGWIDVTPDSVPVISPVESLPGFWLAAGFSGHGFGIGPGAGRLAADLVNGDHPSVDPTPFRLSRLVDGSRLSPGSM
jgi:glycine/D-amino acid oxidase-like deaminating enzyme